MRHTDRSLFPRSISERGRDYANRREQTHTVCTVMGLTRASISSKRVIVIVSVRRSGDVSCRSRAALDERRKRAERAAARERERGNESDEVALFIHAGNERFIGPD